MLSIHPETERLLDRVVVVHLRLAGMALVVDERDFGLAVVMGRKPVSPVGAGGGVGGGLEEPCRNFCPTTYRRSRRVLPWRPSPFV